MGVVSNLLVALSAAAAVLAAPAVEVPVIREADFDFHSNFSSLAAMFRRQNPNYNQDYTTGGQVNFSPSSNGFTLQYNVQQDFVVGRGWQTGDSTPINFQGSFTPTGGVGLFTIYGWTTNPLVEYYIIESEQNYPTQGTQKGSLTSDGGSYQIWQHQQTNQPSIQGTSTFQQYISIRQGGRSSGTVTLKNHFDAWASHGMQMGSMNFQVLAVESWSGSGSASQSISKGGSGSSPGTGSSSTSSAPSSSSPTGSSGGSSGGASAQWGQCGGIGWTGPTTCQAGYTCHYSNAYYSQCY